MKHSLNFADLSDYIRNYLIKEAYASKAKNLAKDLMPVFGTDFDMPISVAPKKICVFKTVPTTGDEAVTGPFGHLCVQSKPFHR